MVKGYHKQYIQQPIGLQKCDDGKSRLHPPAVIWSAIGLVALAAFAACAPVEVVEGDATHVSVRYDGVTGGLDQATALAGKSCGRYGRTARLRRTYHEGLGLGERFAFFDCV